MRCEHGYGPGDHHFESGKCPPVGNTTHSAICPICGLSANNGTVTHSLHVSVATFICTRAHLFTVTWLEVEV